LFSTSRKVEQNQVWVGMAKETAHQLGTPLSSLMAWVEYLKLKNVDENTIMELSKDINRLETITERFSKIGSVPKLENENVIEVLNQTLEYLKVRISKNIEVELKSESANLLAGLVYGNIRRMSMIPGISHFLLGGKDSTGFYLFDIFPDGSITLIDDYVSSGSGSVFAYGVLESSFDKNMSIDEGINLAVKSINAALQRDTYSGNGINVVTITKKGLKWVITKELNTQLTV